VSMKRVTPMNEDKKSIVAEFLPQRLGSHKGRRSTE